MTFCQNFHYQKQNTGNAYIPRLTYSVDKSIFEGLNVQDKKQDGLIPILKTLDWKGSQQA